MFILFVVCVYAYIAKLKFSWRRMEKKNFSAKRSMSLVPIAILLLCTIVSLTVAFFFSSDWATKYVQLSGRVSIEAVGKGTAYNSIEDTVSSCNLDIDIDRDYGVLIPNAPLSIYANCKVNQSTTKPLLRAKMEVSIFDTSGNSFSETGEHNVAEDMTILLKTNILDGSNWAFFEGYYYYLETPTTNAQGTSVLKEVDATSEDVIVPFLNDPITVPSYIDDSYSGLSIKITIVFQAIQNYIANKVTGERITPNTITNSLIIFNDFEENSGE